MRDSSSVGRLDPGARVLVTGAAGFIGSHLSERLVDLGHDVVGVDCFTDFYSRAIKRRNLMGLKESSRFTFHRVDLSRDPLDHLMEGVDVVIHLAAQAGVRSSFGEGFEPYLRHNVRSTQRLLEAAVARPPVSFVYASSSSVYGNAAEYPTVETTERRPVSPYGMTKVATEELAAVYHRCYGVPVIGLRYFTAYGPRQRPDMAFSRFIARALRDEVLPILGDGRQVRDFTYVDDIVGGTIAAAEHGRPGAAYNIGGGQPVELMDAIGLIEELAGRPIRVAHGDAQIGEARQTGCDPSLARTELGYEATTTLAEGLAAQFEWTVRGAGRVAAGAR
jgi:nucleoside-diphosphate-sugar epimerase